MTFLKSIDDQLEDLDFRKIFDEQVYLVYEKRDAKLHRVHRVSLIKEQNEFVLCSYEQDGIRNDKSVGLSETELFLFLRKIKSLRAAGLPGMKWGYRTPPSLPDTDEPIQGVEFTDLDDLEEMDDEEDE